MYRQSQLFKFANMETSSKDHIFSFKAGKMILEGKLVTPIKDKRGLIYVQYQDDILHFCWMNRYTDEVEDDLILLPGDAEFLELPQCKNGRAFVLKLKDSKKRAFFWSQEPVVDDKKIDFAAKINDIIKNQENRVASQTRVKNSLRDLLNTEQGTQKLANLFGNSNKSNPLMRLLSLYSSEMERNTRKKQNSSKEALTQKSRISLTKSNDVETSKTAATYPQRTFADLSTSINMDALRPLLANETFMKRIRERLPDTKTKMNTKEEISKEFQSTVYSPQFRQALSAFSYAFYNGNLAPVIEQFELGQGCVDAAAVGNLEQFCRCLTEREHFVETPLPKNFRSKVFLRGKSATKDGTAVKSPRLKNFKSRSSTSIDLKKMNKKNNTKKGP